MTEYAYGRDQHPIAIAVITGLVATATLEWYGLLTWLLAVTLATLQAAFGGYLLGDYVRVFRERRQEVSEE